eukprot:TRINITY_DN8399_c0_g2_i2.p1 TRINITY_DN8399_c0_g2~~TRINITY_DN8399_c0_g2_i2.p1  ORF type:complete len:402 (-),score=5.50 TRINITY_DN8399_c0_g2_i2:612-1817(-)
MLKLEFCLSVYFTIYPLHEVNPSAPDLAKYKAEVTKFKEFLELRGPLCVDVKELRHFYLLPLIPNPKTSPLFNKIFTSKWVANLRKSLKVLLHKIPDNIETNAPIKNHSSSFNDSAFPDNTKKLLRFSKELLDVAVAALNGRTIELNFIRSSEQRIEEYETAIFQSDQSHVKEKDSSCTLNYSKIKNFLASVTDHKALLNLLQALCLNVCLAQNSSGKSSIIAQYMNSDLLDCRASCSLLQHLLSNKTLASSVVKLLNIMATKCIGVRYITSTEKPLKLLLKLLFISVRQKVMIGLCLRPDERIDQTSKQVRGVQKRAGHIDGARDDRVELSPAAVAHCVQPRSTHSTGRHADELAYKEQGESRSSKPKAERDEGLSDAAHSRKHRSLVLRQRLHLLPDRN